MLQAALGVFSQRGFKGATVREIARLASVNHGTIRYHFGSKDRLWRAAVSFLFERQERELDYAGLARQGLSDVDFVREAVGRFVRYCARHPEHARIAVLESVLGGERLRWMSREHIRPMHAVATSFLRGSMQRGLVKQLDLVSLLYVLALASQSVFLLEKEARAVHGIDPFSAEFVERHVETILGLLLR
ncbi:MAG: TetR/AcrR family transcriptional regulator [Thermodesulfobacteriota bacterium]